MGTNHGDPRALPCARRGAVLVAAWESVYEDSAGLVLSIGRSVQRAAARARIDSRVGEPSSIAHRRKSALRHVAGAGTAGCSHETWWSRTNEGRLSRAPRLAIVGGFLAGLTLWRTHAEKKSRVHTGGGAHARSRHLRQRNNLQLRQRRPLQAPSRVRLRQSACHLRNIRRPRLGSKLESRIRSQLFPLET